MGEDLILDIRWGISPVAHKVFEAPNLVVMSSTDGREMNFFFFNYGYLIIDMAKQVKIL